MAARKSSRSDLVRPGPADLAGVRARLRAACPSSSSTRVKQELTLPKFLQTVCPREQGFREERRVRIGLKLSGLPVGKSLESFDFAFQRSVDKSQIDLLARSEFVWGKEVVLLLGPPGVGKSHLAAGLGVKAVQNGCSVAFMSADPPHRPGAPRRSRR